MIIVEKRLIYFGRRQRGTGSEGSWGGIPDSTRLLAADFKDTGGLQNPLNTFDQTAVAIAAPGRSYAARGPITCIAIAPGSPMESVDLHIGSPGGKDVHRVSVGAPFIGSIGEGHVWITPTRSIPLLFRDSANLLDSAAFQRQIVAWDMDAANTIDDATAASTICAPLVPVRLEIYHGGYPSLAGCKRAPYSASFVWEVKTGAPAITPGMFVIADGRRRVRVVAAGTNLGTANMQVFGVDSLKNVHNTVAVANDLSASGRHDRPYFDELLAATNVPVATPLIFDYEGNPYFAFYVRFSSAVDGDNGHCDVHCWDD